MRVHIITTAEHCELNANYSTRLSLYLSQNGHIEVNRPSEAECILLSTCAFDKIREDHTRLTIENLQNALGPNQTLLVAGCFPKMFDELGTRGRTHYLDLQRPEELDDFFAAKLPFSEVSTTQMDPRFHSAKSLNVGEAYLLIAEGCTFNCSYCFIKKAKGSVKSIPPEVLREQYLKEIERGVRNFVLLADDAGSYGKDIGLHFEDLLETFWQASPEGKFQIQYFHPAVFIKRFDQLRPYFERGMISSITIPLQSTSNRLLKLMRRPYDGSAAIYAVERMRAYSPDTFFQTQMIAGYPTETNEEFVSSVFETLAAFDRVLFFSYSDREGVAASKMEPLPETQQMDRFLFLNMVSALSDNDRLVTDSIQTDGRDANLTQFEVVEELRNRFYTLLGKTPPVCTPPKKRQHPKDAITPKRLDRQRLDRAASLFNGLMQRTQSKPLSGGIRVTSVIDRDDGQIIVELGSKKRAHSFTLAPAERNPVNPLEIADVEPNTPAPSPHFLKIIANVLAKANIDFSDMKE